MYINILFLKLRLIFSSGILFIKKKSATAITIFFYPAVEVNFMKFYAPIFIYMLLNLLSNVIKYTYIE